MSAASPEVKAVEVPFEFRHSCWFCGEPYATYFTFPPVQSSRYDLNRHIVLDCPHPTLAMQTCNECCAIASKARCTSIFQVKQFVKGALIKQYRKDLAIGINLTPQSLAESEFEDGNFAGFQRSAWFMYEVAKARVNYQAWPIIVDGIQIQDTEIHTEFLFDDVYYPSISDAVKHYAKTFALDEHYFSAVLQHMWQVTGGINLADVSSSTFAKAVRFCRLLVGSTPDERKRAFKALTR